MGQQALKSALGLSADATVSETRDSTRTGLWTALAHGLGWAQKHPAEGRLRYFTRRGDRSEANCRLELARSCWQAPPFTDTRLHPRVHAPRAL